MTRPVVMWFRRDLRTVDHAALSAAASCGPVVPLFVVDPAFDRAGAVRRATLAQALHALSAGVPGGLTVRRGDPVEVVTAVARQAGATQVVVTRDANPYGRRRDASVAAALAAGGVTLHGVGWNYTVGPGTVRKANGTPYAVFTPFARAWAAQQGSSPVSSRVAPADVNWRPLPGDDKPRLLTTTPPDWLTDVTMLRVGQNAALDRWHHFVHGALATYSTARNRPDMEGTSRMSAALRWGAVHPSQLLADLGPDGDHDRFRTELIWREFYADVLLHHPQSAWNNLNQRMDAMPVDTDADAHVAFARWRAGQTGFPIIDAGMRQLATTGWMHNRVRMLTASFLVKDLHLPWQWGARYFLDHLADGDLASNNHGWQWCAGTGTDAAPYFRIFNPTVQSRRFDPDGEYIRRFVPELRGVKSGAVHEPGLHRPDGYPPPMVDHATERLEALARYRHATAGTR